MIARRHGGRLVTAPSPRGARLVLELPLAAPRAAAAPRVARRCAGGARPRRRSARGCDEPRRRAALLLGLALVLGALAASDVARREAALRAELAPLVDVVVAARDARGGPPARAGGPRAPGRCPSASRPAGARDAPPELLAGRRLAVPVAAGGPVGPLLLEPPAPPPGAGVGRGQRAAEVVAAAAPGTVAAGARVDVLVTRDRGAGAGAHRARARRTSRCSRARAAPADGARREGGRMVAATLRVTVRQAVYLAAAGAFAREIRLLARAPGDRGRVGAVSAVG